MNKMNKMNNGLYSLTGMLCLLLLSLFGCNQSIHQESESKSSLVLKRVIEQKLLMDEKSGLVELVLQEESQYDSTGNLLISKTYDMPWSNYPSIPNKTITYEYNSNGYKTLSESIEYDVNFFNRLYKSHVERNEYIYEGHVRTKSIQTKLSYNTVEEVLKKDVNTNDMKIRMKVEKSNSNQKKEESTSKRDFIDESFRSHPSEYHLNVTYRDDGTLLSWRYFNNGKDEISSNEIFQKYDIKERLMYRKELSTDGELRKVEEFKYYSNDWLREEKVINYGLNEERLSMTLDKYNYDSEGNKVSEYHNSKNFTNENNFSNYRYFIISYINEYW